MFCRTKPLIFEPHPLADGLIELFSPIFFFSLSSSLSISQVYKQTPFQRPPCPTNVLSFSFSWNSSVFFLSSATCHAKSGGHGAPTLMVRCECGREPLRDRHSKSPADESQRKDAAKFVVSGTEVSVKRLSVFVSVSCFEMELKNQASQACKAPLLCRHRHCSTWNTLLDTIKSRWQVCFKRLFVTLTQAL